MKHIILFDGFLAVFFPAAGHWDVGGRGRKLAHSLGKAWEEN